MIGYVTSCVDKFKQELGDDFVWFTPEPEDETEDTEGEEGETEDDKVTPDTTEGESVDEDDSGMSAAGIVFLVLFLLALVAGGVYGAILYRRDRQCFRKNWTKCRNCQLWQRMKNSKLC